MKRLQIYTVPLIILCVSAFTLSTESILENYNLSSSPKSVHLTGSLTEISGIAFTPDNRLFAHQDESAVIYELNIGNGKINKWFNVGRFVLTDDFEDIAIINVTFYLVTSRGDLYRFYEQPDRGYSQYTKFSTGLKPEYDVEGLCYDPETHSLLLACKGSPDKKTEFKYVYSFDLNSKKLLTKPRFQLSLKEIKNKSGIKNFSPTGIERNPVSGTFFIISSNENAIIEISKDGRLLAFSKLDKSIHKQPEGISFSKDNSLFISDEGNKSEARLSKYSFTK
ncbi:MAG: SdiA-regulated domain-containing protein [Ignavibacteriales bacterium]|nr:MAG: SdiA-regulated domain-containing protein [Ignavibacteriales bacterium]